MRSLKRNHAVFPHPAILSSHKNRTMDSSEDIIPFDDPIVGEVRQARKEILDSFGGDYKVMLRDIRRRQEERKQKERGSADPS